MTARDRDDRRDWARVKELFHAALERAPGERDDFVRERCNDEAIAEVMALLAAHDRAEPFLETPAARIDPEDADLPERIGPYAVRGLLGRGGMGIVYLAEDRRLGRTVALKALAPRLTGDPAGDERLRHEARAAAVLSHPGIATVYALEEIDGQLYIAGEYVPGETLRDELGRGPLDPLRAIDTVLAVARALAAAHDRGIVHGDLKPENLIRTPAGQVKVLDFGLAYVDAGPDAGAAAGVIGTPGYMAPEQLRRERVDGRTDLFALGIVLHELVTGIHPFAGADASATIANILESDPHRLGDDAPAGVPAEVVRAIEPMVRTCLRKRPEDRFSSVADLAAALDAARRSVAGMMADRGRSDTAPAARRRALWWWQFHQAAATIGYALLLIPLWRIRDLPGGRLGTVLFVAALVGATAAGSVRLHLWFAVNLDPASWPSQQRRSARWRLAGDILVVAAVTVTGLLVLLVVEAWGALLLAAAAAVLISFIVIEPATTRAAFGSLHH